MGESQSYFIPSSESAKREIAALKAAVATRIPYYLEGKPGNGKSSLIRAVAASMQYEVREVIASSLHAVEVAGLPVVNNSNPDEPTTMKAMPDWLRDAIKRPRVMIFLDEWNHGSAAVHASWQVIIQDRVLNGVRIPDETVFVMAGNPVLSSSAGRPLSQPIANRMVHRTYNPAVEDWFEGMAANWNEVNPPERLIVERARISTFLHAPDNTYLLDKGPKDDVDASGAHPTRRSWDNLARILANTDQGDQAVRDILTVGTVGEDAAALFGAWDEDFVIPDIDEVLSDPKSFDWVNEEPDKVYAVLSLIVMTRTGPEHAQAVAEALFEAGQSGARRDIGAGLVVQAIGTIMKMTDAAAADDAMNRLNNRYSDILKSSGMSL